MKIKNKKGVFFTAIALAMISLFLLGYTFYSTIEDRRAVQKRVETMNNAVVDMKEDLERQMYVSGFRMTFIQIDEIIGTGTYQTDSQIRYCNLFFGNDSGNCPDSGGGGGGSVPIEEVMDGVDYEGIVERAEDYLGRANLDVSFENEDFTVTQEDPWNVKFTLIVDMKIVDRSGLADWEEDGAEFVAYVPIHEFEDPFYIVNFGGVSVNKFSKSPFAQINFSNIDEHVNGSHSHYINTTRSPSFLDRLGGTLTAENEFGVESLVYTPDLQNPKTSVSNVDFKYFQSLPGTQQNPPWLYLNEVDEDCDLYDVC